jgi:hypothetical protein
MLVPALVPWTNEEYLHLVQEIEQVINSLDADVGRNRYVILAGCRRLSLIGTTLLVKQSQSES